MSLPGRERIRIEHFDRITVVHLLDRFIEQSFGESNDVEEIADAVESLLERHGGCVVINLERVEQMASYMFGRLLAIRRRLRDRGGRLVLCGLGPFLDECVEILKFRPMFEIHPDVNAAIEACMVAR